MKGFSKLFFLILKFYNINMYTTNVRITQYNKVKVQLGE